MKEIAVDVRGVGIGFFVLLAFGLLVAWMLMIGACTKNTISANRVDAWLQRAEEAGNPAQVSEFLTEYKNALAAWQPAAESNCVWRYPNCDRERYLRVVDGLIARADALAMQPPTETSYQMGLVNLEKDLTDIEPIAFGLWWANGGWPVILFVSLAWIGILISVLFAAAASDT